MTALYELSEKELQDLIKSCEGSLGDYAINNNVQGLSLVGAYNVYDALAVSIRREWRRSRIWRRWHSHGYNKGQQFPPLIYTDNTFSHFMGGRGQLILDGDIPVGDGND